MVSTKLYPDDDEQFLRETFLVTLGGDFKSFTEAYRWSSTDEQFGSVGSIDSVSDGRFTGSVMPSMQDMINSGDGDEGALPEFFSKKMARSTTLGGNDAINAYYGYCENDDVRHPMLKGDGYSMGRVYAENINENQQLVYMTMGLPEYNNALGFYSNAITTSVAEWMNKGSAFRPGWYVGNILGTFVTLPVLPLIWTYNLIRNINRSYEITRYYSLRPEMPLYYQMVNSLIIRIAVNLGLAGDSLILGRDQDVNNDGIPEGLSIAEFDIYRILLKKYQYEGFVKVKEVTTTPEAMRAYPNLNNKDDKVTEEKESTISEGDTSNVGKTKNTVVKESFANYFLDSFYNGGKAGLYDANIFIGFRIEKSTSASESLSNSTKPSPVGEQINSAYETAKDARHATFNYNIGSGPVFDTLETVIGGVGDFLKGFADGVGIGGLSSLLTGAARIDFPEVWDDSSFTTSHSFNMALRSPYGDTYSIFQSIYVPMSMILAAALPRATGRSSYTSPFLVRAFSKGMFSISLGIIDSVSIKRGSDQHGWTVNRNPTAVDVSFTVKDLSPMMYQSMADSELNNPISDLGLSDTNFNEYINTLGGIGLQDRIRFLSKLRRRTQVILNMAVVNKLNPVAWGYNLSKNNILGRLLTIASPEQLIPRN